MNSKASSLLVAATLLAGCNQQQSANQANTVIPSAESHNAASAAAPLSKDQALALMKERHDNMESLGKAMKAAGGELKGSSPDLGTLRKSAATFADLAPKLQGWFPAGTGPDVGKTRAKPEIWQKPEDFALKAHDFEQAANQFQVAAQSGAMDQVNTTFDALGKTCKACHDLYRAPEKH